VGAVVTNNVVILKSLTGKFNKKKSSTRIKIMHKYNTCKIECISLFQLKTQISLKKITIIRYNQNKKHNLRVVKKMIMSHNFLPWKDSSEDHGIAL